MYRDYLKGRIGSLIYITGTLIRGFSTQTFNEKKFEITPDQYVILSLLIENENIMYQRQLAEITFKDRANISRIIEILHKKGFIDKIPDSNGRKIFKLVVTEKGKNVRNKILKTDMELRNIITKGISEEELSLAFHILEKMNFNVKDLVKLQT